MSVEDQILAGEKPETVTVDLIIYKQMKKDIKWLSCLEAAGVDNWEGIDVAKDMMND